jgi:single-strand DNA-binding protein
MDANNLVVLRGTVTSEPKRRELPSGSIVTNIEITTRGDGPTASVPVVVHDRPVDVGTGDDVVVVGHVQRRFFRAGGITQSRTEVVAARVVPARRARTAARAVEAAASLLSPTDAAPDRCAASG